MASWMTERIFKRVFADTKDHVSGLTSARAIVWWDGQLLLLDGTIHRRNSSTHEWSEDAESRVLTCGVVSYSQAVRSAVRMTDEFFAAAFESDDAACRSEG